MTFSEKNFHTYSRPKILMTFFFSHRPGFSDFYSLYCVKFVYDPFFTRKSTISEKNSLTTPFFLLCSSFRARPTTLLLKILGRTNAWAVPHLKFLGGPSPQSPLGLRHCS